MNSKKPWLGLMLLAALTIWLPSLRSYADDATTSQPAGTPLRLPLERLVTLDRATWFAFDAPGFAGVQKIYAAYLDAFQAQARFAKEEKLYLQLVELSEEKYLEASDAMAAVAADRDHVLQVLKDERKARLKEKLRSDLQWGLGLGGGVLGGLAVGLLIGLFAR